MKHTIHVDRVNPKETQMTDLARTQLSALAKAAMFPALYAAFFAWSYALLLHV